MMKSLGRSTRLAGLLLLACQQSSALALTLCVDEQLHPPYLLARGGQLPDLIAAAAARAEQAVELHRAPVRRCIAELRSGLADGYPMAAVSPALAREYVFPRNHGAIDTSRAAVRARMLVFRRRGEALQWDGQHFLPQTVRIMSPSNLALVQQRLIALGLQLDDNAKSMEQNFRKLLGGRGDLVIGMENDGTELLQRSPFAGRIEALTVPFSDEYYYLIFSRSYYAAHPESAERMWDALRSAQPTTP